MQFLMIDKMDKERVINYIEGLFLTILMVYVSWRARGTFLPSEQLLTSQGLCFMEQVSSWV
jgi:hypothetical protein